MISHLNELAQWCRSRKVQITISFIEKKPFRYGIWTVKASFISADTKRRVTEKWCRIMVVGEDPDRALIELLNDVIGVCELPTEKIRYVTR